MEIKAPGDYLRNRPYTWCSQLDVETNTYTAWIAEFPGCVTQGHTLDEAYASLYEVAQSWIQSALDCGQEIPRTFWPVEGDRDEEGEIYEDED